ncbi:CAN5-like protein [Mya arenaria]|uniref:CAN5-like protein n=1 Tax=Mya arenaria TaxID=6604 RepID=A0ABY7G294_MYAAR|nr:CAN5-like protein [Mya arenaria]
MGLFETNHPFKGQVFKDIRSKCIKAGSLFKDPTFPPTGSSIYYSKSCPADIVWKRPGPESVLTTFPRGRLATADQEWGEKNKYAGIFHFKFWRCGTWVDVVIDDYLPTRGGRLIFVHSNTRNEFWSALLEKAYAKLAGDYESLVAGNAKDALVDMTGGATANDMEAELACGLVKGHAYSVTAVKKIKLGTGLFSVFARDHLQMVRCRNPWGGTEWKGAWSDGSAEWKKVSDSQKKELGLTFDDNGEFWMSYEDFCQYFTSMDVCHMINRSFFSIQKTWREDNDEDELMISLEQKDKRVDKGKDNYTIGFSVYKSDVNRKYRMHDRLERVSSGPFVLSRSVFSRVKFTRGRYCIVPSTFDPGKCGEYVLRMYASNQLNLTELLHDEPMPGKCCCFTRKRSQIAATQITLVKAEGLEPQDAGKSGSIENNYKEDTLNPEWNDRVTLYRKDPYKDVIIEVWNHNIIKDQLMGICTLPMEKPHQYTGGNVIKGYNLFTKGKEGPVQKPGRLWLKVYHTDNMAVV